MDLLSFNLGSFLLVLPSLLTFSSDTWTVPFMGGIRSDTLSEKVIHTLHYKIEIVSIVYMCRKVENYCTGPHYMLVILYISDCKEVLKRTWSLSICCSLNFHVKYVQWIVYKWNCVAFVNLICCSVSDLCDSVFIVTQKIKSKTIVCFPKVEVFIKMFPTKINYP